MYIDSSSGAYNTLCARALNENSEVPLSNVNFKIVQCRSLLSHGFSFDQRYGPMILI